MTDPTRTYLPPHITEDDVRAIAELVLPSFGREAWNTAIETVERAITATRVANADDGRGTGISRAQLEAILSGARLPTKPSEPDHASGSTS